MALSPEEKELSVQASFGDDIMQQREAAVAIEDIRYDDPDDGWEVVGEAAEEDWEVIGEAEEVTEVPVNNDPEVLSWLPDEVKIYLPKYSIPGMISQVLYGTHTPSTGISLDDDEAAFMVTTGEAMGSVYRGGKQLAGKDIEEMKRTAAAVDKLYEQDSTKNAAFAGELTGAVVEPLGFLLPGGKAKSVATAYAKGFGIGAGYGSMLYVEEGQTRLGNTLLGGTMGATINRVFHGARNHFSNKAVQKANKDLDKFERYWAEELLATQKGAARTADVIPVSASGDALDGIAQKALRRMGPSFNLTSAQKVGRVAAPPRNLDEARYIIDSYGPDKNPSSLTKIADKYFGILSTRIGNISPEVKGMLRMHDYNTHVDTHNYFNRVTPFLKQISKLKGEQKLAINRALAEGNFDGVRVQMNKLGPQAIKDFEDTVAVMNELGTRNFDSKVIKNLVPNYMPRYIKDIDGFMEAIKKERRLFGAVDDAIKKAESKVAAKGQVLSADAKSQIIHRAVFGSRSNKAPRGGYTYERKFKTIPNHLLKYYATPEESIHTYIKNSVNDIHKRAFFGDKLKTVKLEDGFELMDVDNSAVNFVNKRLPHLSHAESKDLMNMLSSRFGPGEKSPNGWLQGMKNTMYAMLLGNPISAATQLGDLGVSMYINGFRNTLKGFVESVRIPGTEKTLKKGAFTVKDWGILDNLAEEFASTTASAKWLRRSFKVSGFQYVDRLGKDTFVNAAYRRLQQMPKAQFMKKYRGELGDDVAEQTYKELINNEATTNVKAMLFAKLADVQPISPSEVPQGYLNNPNGRIAYMLKTFMLKQVDVIRQTAYVEARKGNHGLAMKNMMSYGIIMGAAGMTSADIKLRMLNVEPEHEWWDKAAAGNYGPSAKQLSNEVGMNLFKTFGWSEYTADKLNSGRVKDTLVDQFVPPFEIFEKVAKGDPQAIPIYGRMWHFWFNGGAEEYMAKRRADKLKDAMQPITDIKKDLKEAME